jgi:hypothetical protein
MSTMLRKVRIAFSVVCGILCVLLIVLHVRSFTNRDDFWVRYGKDGYIGILSLRGCIFQNIYYEGVRPDRPFSYDYFTIRSSPINLGHFAEQLSFFKFDAWTFPERCGYQVPHWFLILVTASFSALPWVKWQFSLRTLLVVTTIAALLLGAIVYAIR